MILCDKFYNTLIGRIRGGIGLKRDLSTEEQRVVTQVRDKWK